MLKGYSRKKFEHIDPTICSLREALTLLPWRKGWRIIQLNLWKALYMSTQRTCALAHTSHRAQDTLTTHTRLLFDYRHKRHAQSSQLRESQP